MLLRRSPHCLTLYVSPLGPRLVAAFIIGIGIIVLLSLRPENLTPLFPAILIILSGLLFLRQSGGATLVYFDKQTELVRIHHQKLLGAQHETFDIPVKDIVDVCVEESTSIEHELEFRRPVVSHYFQLLVKVREGYSLPLTPSITAGSQKTRQKYQAIAQEIKQFLII